MADNPRIHELRRRVDSDPASIAFAQLAEEHRRSGEYEDAVRVCRAGLSRHPTYLSARVTLGQALIELGQYGEAEAELARVLQSSPENLAAVRGLAEIHQRRGELQEALALNRKALTIAKHDVELEEAIHDLTRQIAGAGADHGAQHATADDTDASPRPSPGAGDPLTIPLSSLSPELEAAADEFTKALQALDELSLNLPAAALEAAEIDTSSGDTGPAVEPHTEPQTRTAEDAAVQELESWLDAIVRDRQARAARQ